MIEFENVQKIRQNEGSFVLFSLDVNKVSRIKSEKISILKMRNNIRQIEGRFGCKESFTN